MTQTDKHDSTGMGQTKRSVSGIRSLTDEIQRQWLRMLGDKVEPPPCSRERQTAWRAGYDDALRDLAEQRAKGQAV